MATERYEAIVLGLGGVGSAALYHLAARGRRVLGLDRFAPPHDRGSTHGDTRVIRLAYFEHPGYVPLLQRSYELWEDLQARVGIRLYEQVGLLEVGPADGVVIPGVLASARAHGLEVEALDAAQVSARFGEAFAVPDGAQALFERRAGYLRVERCVSAHLDLARVCGAEVRVDEPVTAWAVDGDGVSVETAAGRRSADRLVIAAGAWAGPLLEGLAIPLVVRRKPLLWYDAPATRYGAEAGAPCFFYEVPGGQFYGFPRVDAHGLKVAQHSGGEAVSDPLTVDRALRDADRAPVEAFLRAHLPGVDAGALRRHAVCMYTCTPDDHFVVDVHPRAPQVCFAAGLSGHGFKMASGLGEALADLAERGRSELPLGLFACDRPALAGA